MQTSVIIPHHNRKNNLENTLAGLNRQSVSPSEVLVVDFNRDLTLTAEYDFDLRIIEYSDDWKYLPVAAARNLGVSHSRHQKLIFLDVDCIPNPTFVEDLINIKLDSSALIMADPYYLLSPIGNDWTYEALNANSIPHHQRPEVNELTLEENYTLFWSLCFCLTKTTFERLGKFDERYTGYGIEDTDFAFKTERAGVPFYLHPTRVFHQQHQLYRPPLNQLEAIVGNCNAFYEKWQTWPVNKILSAFSEMGYISWNSERTESIEIGKLPTPKEMETFVLKNAPYR